jgi:hypothetical protein
VQGQGATAYYYTCMCGSVHALILRFLMEQRPYPGGRRHRSPGRAGALWAGAEEGGGGGRGCAALRPTLPRGTLYARMIGARRRSIVDGLYFIHPYPYLCANCYVRRPYAGSSGDRRGRAPPPHPVDAVLGA